jgi:hypothetical protein
MSGDVGDDLGEFGRFGHGGLAVEFFGQLVASLPELLDFGGQFGHPWRGGLLVYGAVLEAVKYRSTAVLAFDSSPVTCRVR